VINNILNKAEDHPGNLSIMINGDLSSDPIRIVNHFNNYFVNIGLSLAATIPSTSKNGKDYLSTGNKNSMSMHPTTKTEIEQIIKSLKNKSSPGLDGIPNNVVKFLSDFISSPLSNLINYSITNGKFPGILKEAEVLPIYKAGDSIKVENYRPISILNSFSKIYEKVTAARLLKYLNKDNFFFINQHGFRQKHSTSSALTIFNEFISSSIDKNEIPMSIFLDLSKASDTLFS